MKTYIKNFLAASLLIVVLVSCGTSRELPNHPAQCGFGEEASIEQTDQIDKRISPAANRFVKQQNEEALVEEGTVIANGGAKDATSEGVVKDKRSRKNTRVGSTPRPKVKDVIKAVKESKSRGGGGLELILLIILAIILPPLAVAIFEGITGRFWLVLILWILGWGVGWWLFGGAGGLFSLVAVILALLIVLGVW